MKLVTVVMWCQVLYVMELVQTVATRLNGEVLMCKKWHIMYLSLSVW